jgi:DNA-binding transcriptional LysR family regulator
MFDALSLKYFEVVAREHSLSRAARILHASQPSVSRRIRQLEREAGSHLFERHAGGVLLTRAGDALVRYVQEIGRLTDEARHVLRRFSGKSGKQLRIGFYQPASTVLVPLLQMLQSKDPEIAVEPIEATRAVLLESLREGEIDLALPGGIPPECLQEFDGLRLPSPDCFYVLPNGHRFARRKRLRLVELKDEGFVGLDEKQFPGYGIAMLEACRLAGFLPQFSVYAHSCGEAIAHVVAGQGITVAPQSAISIPLNASLSLIRSDLHPDWYAIWNASNGNPQLRIAIDLLLDAPPARWGSRSRILPALGSSRISATLN